MRKRKIYLTRTKGTLFRQLPPLIIIKDIFFVFLICLVILIFNYFYSLNQSYKLGSYEAKEEKIIKNSIMNFKKIEKVDTFDEKIIKKEEININKIKKYIEKQTNNKSPITPYLYDMYEKVGKNKNKFYIALAISGVESNFGANQNGVAKCNNYFGYLYISPGHERGCGSKKWTTSKKAILRYLELENNKWLSLYNGSNKSLDNYVNYVNGFGKYCASACTTYKTSLIYFINQFENARS